MDLKALQKAVDSKLVSVQKHPDADLYIYNYTPKVQYERLWDDVTMSARGLILDGGGGFVARPFKKFFNVEEHDTLPVLPFEVYDKADGSLGILYWIDNQPFIATRGSFISEQATHATEILHTKYKHTFDKLDKTKTYLFEIIYPANRIIVNYGDLDDIILLAIIDNKTGLDLPLENIGFPVIKKYNGITDIGYLRQLEEDNKEGFVIRFSNGIRVKLKFEEYVRLHRIVTNVSARKIWECLMRGESLEPILDKVPDEFYLWVKKTEKELVDKFWGIMEECERVFSTEFDTRKEAAEYIMKQKYPSILFGMLDDRNIDPLIWKLIKPPHETPFKNA